MKLNINNLRDYAIQCSSHEEMIKLVKFLSLKFKKEIYSFSEFETDVKTFPHYRYIIFDNSEDTYLTKGMFSMICACSSRSLSKRIIINANSIKKFKITIPKWKKIDWNY